MKVINGNDCTSTEESKAGKAEEAATTREKAPKIQCITPSITNPKNSCKFQYIQRKKENKKEKEECTNLFVLSQKLDTESAEFQ